MSDRLPINLPVGDFGVGDESSPLDKYFVRVFARALILSVPVSIAQNAMQDKHPYGFIYEALCINLAVITAVIMAVLIGAILKFAWELWP